MKSHALLGKDAEPFKGTGEAIQLKVRDQANWLDHVHAFGNPRTAELPIDLQSRLENRTGIAMDDVSVHYNSTAPIQMDALALAAGTNIYLGPGQEKYLPHEAWHVVQQKSGIVQPTGKVRGRFVNDDSGLEHEADTWLSSMPIDHTQSEVSEMSQSAASNVVQRVKGRQVLGGALGLAGAAAAYYLPGYWKLLGLPLALLGTYLGSGIGQDEAPKVTLSGEDVVKKKLEDNSFRVGAGIEEYTSYFGDSFTGDLGLLTEDQKWLDGGAGKAVAIDDYYKNGGLASTVAVGYEKPTEGAYIDLEKDKDNFRYASGNYFQDMDKENDLGIGEDEGLNLITDFNGVLTYTATLSEDVQKYLTLLNVGGVIHTGFYATIYQGSNQISELEWLEQIEGATATANDKGAFRIVKSDAETRVPPLEKIEYQKTSLSNVPERTYRIT